jgi:hypothetical protein
VIVDKLLVQSFIAEILRKVDEIKSTDDENQANISFGERLAFAATLKSLLRHLIAESPDAPAEYGLDFDIDKRVVFNNIPPGLPALESTPQTIAQEVFA